MPPPLKSYRDIDYLLIDLDNTLVFSDKANNMAYLQAIQTTSLIIDNEIIITLKEYTERITSKVLSQYFSKEEIQKIKMQKDLNYINHLNLTKRNEKLFLHLSQVKTIYPRLIIILATNCNEERANLLCKHHHLDKLLNMKLFFQNSLKKYEEAIIKLKIHKNKAFIIEDEITQIHSAIRFGIPSNQIYQEI